MSEGKEILHDLFSSVNQSIDLIAERFVKIKVPKDFVSTANGLETLDATSMRLQFIGESLKKVEKFDADFFSSYPETDWSKIINLRDFISHHYDMLNHEIIFNICEEHIPKLKIQIEKIINDLGNANS